MGSVGTHQAFTYHLYHGSPNANITTLEARANSHTHTGENFIFFTDSQDVADTFSHEFNDIGSAFRTKLGAKGKVYEADVTMKHPLNLTNLSEVDIKNLLKLSDGELTKEMIAKFSAGNNQLLKPYVDLSRLKEFGYDGFIARMYKTGELEYAVFDNSQIKMRR